MSSQPYRSIKEWREEDRPREKLLTLGAQNLSTSELLAILIRTGTGGKSALFVAQELLTHFGSLRKLDNAPLKKLCAISGIGKTKAIEIKAALELARRLVREEVKTSKRIITPTDAINYVRNYYGMMLRDATQEFFYIILLDVRNKPIHHYELSKGSNQATLVDPKEIVRQICLFHASSVILIHNHPSGECDPSAEDESLTNQIHQVTKIVGARVLDHIIIGKNSDDYYSFAKEGKL